MRPFRVLAALLALAAARPAPAQAPTSTAIIPIVKLTDGRVFHQVKINVTMADYVLVKCNEGLVQIPYDLFPDDIRAKLQSVRPKSEVTVKVTGAVAVDGKGAISSGPSGSGRSTLPPPGPQNFFFPGRVFVHGPTAAGIPLPAVLVYAVRPADFAAFNQARLKLHGAAIDAAADKMQRAAPGDARKAALADFLLTVYASFEPAPPAVAVALTDANGRFTISCHELQVVLVARGTVPLGDGLGYMVWAVPDNDDEPSFLTEENLLMR
jgi:hypothetical protein